MSLDLSCAAAKCWLPIEKNVCQQSLWRGYSEKRLCKIAEGVPTVLLCTVVPKLRPETKRKKKGATYVQQYPGIWYTAGVPIAVHPKNKPDF